MAGSLQLIVRALISRLIERLTILPSHYPTLATILPLILYFPCHYPGQATILPWPLEEGAITKKTAILALFLCGIFSTTAKK